MSGTNTITTRSKRVAQLRDMENAEAGGGVDAPSSEGSVTGRDNTTTNEDAGVTFVVDDSLITEEGEWINTHKTQIRFMYHALVSATRRCKVKYEFDYLDDLTFGTFCSFVYRWTSGDDYAPLTDEDTTSSDEDMESESGSE